jgi:hypothetical protein
MARDSLRTSIRPGPGGPKPTPRARVSPNTPIARDGSQHGSSDPNASGTLGDTEVDFALGATEALETIVKTLLTRFEQRGSSTSNCRLLRGNLSEFRVWLEHNRNNADPSYFFEGLAVLEDICKVSLPSCILLEVGTGH